MLTEIYIEALLANEELADQVWAAWDAGVISDLVALWAWWLVASGPCISVAGKRRENDRLQWLRVAY